MSTSNPNGRAYIALEGGGAKGVAHIGALDVLINYYDCRGFSGTSAGSLAAALAAAGFTSNEIINPKNRTTLLCHLDGVNSAMDLFDRWSRAKLFFALFLLRINLSPIGKFISICFLNFTISDSTVGFLKTSKIENFWALPSSRLNLRSCP